MDFFSLLFGGVSGNLVVVEAALIICLFWAALVRPERIGSVAAFRLAMVLLAVAILAPSVIQVTLVAYSAPIDKRLLTADKQNGAVLYALVIPPAILMLAVLAAIESIAPRPRRKQSSGSPPAATP